MKSVRRRRGAERGESSTSLANPGALRRIDPAAGSMAEARSFNVPDLAPDAETFNQGFVPRLIPGLDIIEELPALRHELQQSPA